MGRWCRCRRRRCRRLRRRGELDVRWYQYQQQQRKHTRFLPPRSLHLDLCPCSPTHTHIQTAHRRSREKKCINLSSAVLSLPLSKRLQTTAVSTHHPPRRRKKKSHNRVLPTRPPALYDSYLLLCLALCLEVLPGAEGERAADEDDGVQADAGRCAVGEAPGCA
jgi:hypothetical protein